MTPLALCDLYSGFIGTDSAEYRIVTADLAAMSIAELRQCHRLAPAGSRLRCLADSELGRRAARRLASAVPAAYAAPVRARTPRREEI